MKIPKSPHQYEKKFKQKYTQITLDDESYPSVRVPFNFLILSDDEIKSLLEKTLKRCEYFNKKVSIPNKHIGYDLEEIKEALAKLVLS